MCRRAWNGDTAYDDTHYDLTYNKRGDLTDDGMNYKYKYDGFGRLRQVKKTSNSDLVEEFWYDGLGHRISWKYDTDVDGDVDGPPGSDKTFHFAHDERWRVVATYRESDASPKEQFTYHCAGSDGQGGSSYIDAVILRDQDANTNWVTTAADGVLEKRDFYCQNWRADVVAMVSDAGAMTGWVKYSAYGIPYGIPAGDTNGDGTVNSTDSTNATSWAGTGAGVTHPTADINLDGNINSTDQTAIGGVRSGVNLGWGKLSEASAASGGAAGGNRKGYAGYEFDPVLIDSNWHVRHRVLKSDLGRWTRRDPLGYVDGLGLQSYSLCDPMSLIDPSGLDCTDALSRELCIVCVFIKYAQLIGNCEARYNEAVNQCLEPWRFLIEYCQLICEITTDCDLCVYCNMVVGVLRSHCRSDNQKWSELRTACLNDAKNWRDTNLAKCRSLPQMFSRPN